MRLKAALIAGVHPDLDLLDELLDRCAVEPDFHVREQLTWSLLRYPKDIVVPRLCAEVSSANAQARSQALHTLSKIKDKNAWPVITAPLLRDPNDEVAKAAWRAAVSMVPPGKEKSLAEDLGSQLGRGGRDVQLSLSRALIALGEDAAGPILRKAVSSDDHDVQLHARATEKILYDRNVDFQYAIDQVKVVLAPRTRD